MALRLFIIALIVCGFAGCTDYLPSIRHPGPASVQRERAEFFDPYPDPDLGPPVGGGRPTGFDRPAPENEGVQNASAYTYRYGQPPPTGLYHTRAANPATVILPGAPAGAMSEAPLFGQ